MWSRLSPGQLCKRLEALFLSGREKCQHTVPLCSGYVLMCESWWFNYIFVPLFIIIVRGWSTDQRQRCLTNVSRYEWEAVGLQGTDVGSKVHCVDSGHFSATNVSKDLDNNVCEDLANPAWLWDSLFCQTSSSHGKQGPWCWWQTYLGVQRSRQYVAKSLSRGKQGSEGTHRDHIS